MTNDLAKFIDRPKRFLTLPSDPFELASDKVAIVGFAPPHRAYAPYDDPTWEIWGLNEAYRHDIMGIGKRGPEPDLLLQDPYEKRWDRWFQIHPRWTFTRLNNPNDPEHWYWLQAQRPMEEGGFPIYMQQKYDDVPASVRYPLTELIEKYGVHYYTSSFAVLCALAMSMGAKTIGVWGFNMATQTEYQYQKGSTEFWLGMAKASGIEIIIPPESHLLKAKIYGWEVTQLINRQDLEFRKNVVQAEHERVIAELNALAGARQELEQQFATMKDGGIKKRTARRGQEIYQAEINLLSRANALGGRLQEINDLINYLDNMTVDGRIGLTNVSVVDLSDVQTTKIQIPAGVDTKTIGKVMSRVPIKQ